ncbi:hypothetical protein NE398_14115 [Clostridium tertium]|uniref:Uncharacterized protein n=1 Tax=Clostridium tertium TaxID=1559 RepID=A0A9X3XNJ3_9CLOT|nr:hypothetical protein [Clostridium tertium]MDC4241289.1 hypothetical protein [Clostridium tertium]
MNYEKMCELIKGIIESEFTNVQEFREEKFADRDIEHKQLNQTSAGLMDKLMETLSEEQKDLLNELDSAIACEWVNLCRFYFHEGVAAGLSNLKFLENIPSVCSYFR